MTNPFAESSSDLNMQQQQPLPNPFDQPREDSTGANFGLSNGVQQPMSDQKIGHNPFSSGADHSLGANQK